MTLGLPEGQDRVQDLPRGLDLALVGEEWGGADESIQDETLVGLG